MNAYKEAPTWLYNLDGESKLFKTQEEVDEAWANGWFGPPHARTPLLSEQGLDHMTKAEIAEAVEDDPRYGGLTVNVGNTKDEILTRIKEFEEEHDLVDVIIEE